MRQILEATVSMLEEEGFSGVTMQKIADRAGINVAAVYSYFPNKYQVIAELSRRFVVERDDIRRGQFDALLLRDGDWVENFAESLRDLAILRAEQRGSAAVMSALRSTPVLLELSQEALETVAERLEDFLRRADPDFDGDQRLRARVISEAVSALFDFMQNSGRYDPDQILDEAIKLVRGYLRNS